jgi:uracil-DNA glycosylase
MRELRRVRVRLALGRIGFEAFWKARRGPGPDPDLPDLKPKPAFGHGVHHALPEGGWLLCTYHPSQQNTSTGVLTREMWHAVFDTALRLRDQV